MEFVTQLGSAAFVLATKGFLGRRLLEQTTKVHEYRYKTRLPKYARIVWYFGYAILVFGSFGVFWYLQGQRRIGVDNEVYVQLDDTATSELFSTSGVYKGCTGYKSDTTGDIGYIGVNIGGDGCPERKDNEPVYPDTFVYCWDLSGWVFVREETDDPCNKRNYILRSFLDDGDQDTDAFDILSHSKANWVVARSQYGGEVLLEHTFVESPQKLHRRFIDCNVLEVDGVDFQMLDRKYFPLHTEEDSNPFDDDLKGVPYDDIFDLIYRPMYYFQEPDSNDTFKVVAFNGLRWIYMDLNPRKFAESIEGAENCESDDDPFCWKTFLLNFHENRPWLFDTNIANVSAMSDPMFLLSESDTGFPTADLTWYDVEPFKKQYLGPEREIDTLVQCAAKDIVCDDDEVSFRLSVITDEFPEEFTILSFYGQDLSDMQSKLVDYIRKDPGQHEINFTSFDREEVLHILFSDSSEGKRYDMTACVPRTKCVQVIALDSVGDGLQEPGRFDVFYDGIRVTGLAGSEDSDDDDFSCKSFQVGDLCNKTRIDDKVITCDATTVIEYHPNGGLVPDDPALIESVDSSITATP